MDNSPRLAAAVNLEPGISSQTTGTEVLNEVVTADDPAVNTVMFAPALMGPTTGTAVAVQSALGTADAADAATITAPTGRAAVTPAPSVQVTADPPAATISAVAPGRTALSTVFRAALVGRKAKFLWPNTEGTFDGLVVSYLAHRNAYKIYFWMVRTGWG